ncbi:MAG: hypothetical protein FWD68_12330 [Alphaproteobacteria bacterium]|nr:hypothetical protein [Alphaproteobacteria bacterium]
MHPALELAMSAPLRRNTTANPDRPRDVTQSTHHLGSLWSLTPPGWSIRETWLLATLVSMALIAALGPAIGVARWHVAHFADTRTLLGLPNAADVLSNLPFLIMGIWGLVRLRRFPDAPAGTAWFGCD